MTMPYEKTVGSTIVWNLSFRRSIRVGDKALRDEVSQSFSDGPKRRFDVANKLRLALSEIFAGTETLEPIYNLISVYPPAPTDNEGFGLVGLIFLPRFDHPSRMFVFLDREEDKCLGLLEYRTAADSRFGPVSDVDFVKTFQIEERDRIGFRNAMIKILNERGAPRENALFRVEDEVIV